MSLLDENTAILVQLEANGSNLGCAKRVDFSHLFPSLAAASSFAAATEAEGFEVAVDQSHSLEAAYDVTASKVMLPSADAITEAEARLSWLAELHQGRADGWGFFDD
jgi:regulator of RNase E activity RraB